MRRNYGPRPGTGALDDIFVPRRDAALEPSKSLRDIVRQLRLLAEDSSDLSVTFRALGSAPYDFDPVVWTRLQAFGQLTSRAQAYHFQAFDPRRRWALSPSYIAFLSTWGPVEVLTQCDALSFSILPPLAAALQSDDLWDALHDHRDEGWPYEEPIAHGFGECLVFAARGRGHLNGWAFDTRERDEEGEHRVVAVSDFSGDDGKAMDALWPATGPTSGPNFTAWFEQRIEAIAGAVA